MTPDFPVTPRGAMRRVGSGLVGIGLLGFLLFYWHSYADLLLIALGGGIGLLIESGLSHRTRVHWGLYGGCAVAAAALAFPPFGLSGQSADMGVAFLNVGTAIASAALLSFAATGRF